MTIDKISFKTNGINNININKSGATHPDENCYDDEKKFSAEKMLGLTLAAVAIAGGIYYCVKRGKNPIKKKAGGQTAGDVTGNSAIDTKVNESLLIKNAKPFERVKKRADGTLVRVVGVDSEGRIDCIVRYAPNGVTINEYKKIRYVDAKDKVFVESYTRGGLTGANFRFECTEHQGISKGFRKTKGKTIMKGFSSLPNSNGLLNVTHFDKKTSSKAVAEVTNLANGTKCRTVYGKGKSKVEFETKDGRVISKTQYDSIGNMRKKELFNEEGLCIERTIIDKKGRKRVFDFSGPKAKCTVYIEKDGVGKYSQKYFLDDISIKDGKCISYYDNAGEKIGGLKTEPDLVNGVIRHHSQIRFPNGSKKDLYYKANGMKDNSYGTIGEDTFKIIYDDSNQKMHETIYRQLGQTEEKVWQKGVLKKETIKDPFAKTSIEVNYDGSLRHTIEEMPGEFANSPVKIEYFSEKAKDSADGWRTFEKTTIFKDGGKCCERELFPTEVWDSEGRLVKLGDSVFTYKSKKGSDVVDLIEEVDQVQGFKIIYKGDLEHPIERYLKNDAGEWLRVKLEF